MGTTTKLEQLSAEYEKLLKLYGDSIFYQVKKAVDKTAKESNTVIKGSTTFQNRTGEYVRHFAIKRTINEPFEYAKAWYVKPPDYRRTHLLEHGHATQNGGRTRAFPHISKGTDYAEMRMEQLIKELIDNIT